MARQVDPDPTGLRVQAARRVIDEAAEALVGLPMGEWRALGSRLLRRLEAASGGSPEFETVLQDLELQIEQRLASGHW